MEKKPTAFGGAVALPVFLVSLPFTFLPVLLPMLTQEMGYSTLQMTTLFSLYSLTVLLVRLAVGRMNDRKGPAGMLAAAALVYALAYGLMALATGFIPLLLGRLAQGLAGVMLTLSLYSMVAERRKDLGGNLGYFDNLKSQAGLLGVLLCFFALRNRTLLEGWPRIMGFSAIAAAAGGLFALLRLRGAAIQSAPAAAKAEPAAIPAYTTWSKRIWLFNALLNLLAAMTNVLLVPYMTARYQADMWFVAWPFSFHSSSSPLAAGFWGALRSSLGTGAARGSPFYSRPLP